MSQYPARFQLAALRPLRRSPLLRELLIVLAVKIAALALIKVLWFSDAVAPPPQEVAQVLLGVSQPK